MKEILSTFGGVEFVVYLTPYWAFLSLWFAVFGTVSSPWGTTLYLHLVLIGTSFLVKYITGIIF
jgi:hypothetical protein